MLYSPLSPGPARAIRRAVTFQSGNSGNTTPAAQYTQVMCLGSSVNTLRRVDLTGVSQVEIHLTCTSAAGRTGMYIGPQFAIDAGGLGTEVSASIASWVWADGSAASADKALGTTQQQATNGAANCIEITVVNDGTLSDGATYITRNLAAALARKGTVRWVGFDTGASGFIAKATNQLHLVLIP